MTRARALRLLFALFAAAVVPVVGFVSCAASYAPLVVPSRPPSPLPPEIAARFDYEDREKPPAFHVVQTDTCEGWDVFTVSGTVLVKGDVAPMKVEVEYYRSKNAPSGRAPALVFTPILGGGGDISRIVAHHYADHGFHVAVVARGAKILAPEWPEEEVELYLRRGVVTRRRVIDWLLTRAEVDPDRIAGFGISMGGIVTSILAAVEPRLHSAVICLAGGDIAGIVAASDEPRLVNYRGARAKARNGTADDVRAALDRALISDPLRLAAYADPRRCLVFMTLRDTTVPTANQRLLRDALGGPATYELPVGHYGAILFMPYIKGKSASWLDARLARPRETRG